MGSGVVAARVLARAARVAGRRATRWGPRGRGSRARHGLARAGRAARALHDVRHYRARLLAHHAVLPRQHQTV